MVIIELSKSFWSKILKKTAYIKNCSLGQKAITPYGKVN